MALRDAYKRSWAEAVATGLTLGPLFLFIILAVVLDALPCGRFPGDYPPLAPPRSGSRWLVRPPGVRFWAAFPPALFALYCVGLVVILQTHNLGLEWGLWGVIAMSVVEIGAAIPLGLALRTRPELEVDEQRREILWRPSALWAAPVALPFDAIMGVRVVDTGRRDKLICYPEIAWRSNNGRVRKTRLPISADHEGVQRVVARLQVAVFATTGPVPSSDGPRQTQ